MTTESLGPRVLVLGDVQMDLIVAPLPRDATKPQDGALDRPSLGPEENWKQAGQSLLFRRPGGAWLLYDVLTSAIPGARVETIGRADLAEDYRRMPRPPCPVSLAMLRLYPVGAVKKDNHTYRLDPSASAGWISEADIMYSSSEESEASYPPDVLQRLHRDIESIWQKNAPDLLILHDHHNGFRYLAVDAVVKLLKAGTDLDHPPLILLHSDSPLAEGPLWHTLVESHADRLVLLVNAEDLRNWGITLVEDLSIEQTVADFMYNIERGGHDGPLAQLVRCRCLIVKSPIGLIVHSRHPAAGSNRVNLSYLPNAVTGPSSDPERYGKMVGYSIILLAAIAKGLCWSLSQPADDSAEFESFLETGIRFGAQLGLVLCERHLRNGFVRLREGEFLSDPGSLMPYQALFADIDPSDKAQLPEAWDEAYDIGSVDFEPQMLGGLEAWSRVQLLAGRPGWSTVEDAAVDVVIRGLKAVVNHARTEKIKAGFQRLNQDTNEYPKWNLPERFPFYYATLGSLQLIDRNEIDAFTHIEKLVLKYVADKHWTKPLSIAVFGPPGSGKSFTVKQLLASALGEESLEPLEFNLSQFQNVTDLSNAFHMVQDRGLASNEPAVVFFDEFDANLGTEPLGWLKYFLAPMQDGSFRDEHTTYRVGRAIFVFAGGVSSTFSDFYLTQKEQREFRQAKGPDFVSRLRGHLDIRGINSESEVDEVLTVRRAILLRSLLGKHCASIIDQQTKVANIDEPVVRAFLRTRTYEHGVRSMEAIVQMAAISLSRRKFQRSSVPATAQLGMHVNPQEFHHHLRDSERIADRF